jgi:LCP family protein required for cell wall assembly
MAAVGLCLGGMAAGTLWSQRKMVLATAGGLHPPFGGRKQANILVLGIDDGQGGRGRSDTMLLLRVDTEARRLAALSIPRDTRVTLGEGRFVKINSAHARGGPKLAARAVTDLTGLSVDYTLGTDFDSFSRLVDLVGGIDLDVERAMDYVDHAGDLEIHLKPGPQHLDGAKAIQYVRFRKSNFGHGGDGSDLSRIARQERFIHAVAARCLVGANLLRLPELVREARALVRTDLATSDLLYLGALAKEIGSGQVKVLSVPGKTAMIAGQSYWLPDGQELAEVVRQLDAPIPSGDRSLEVTTRPDSHRG